MGIIRLLNKFSHSFIFVKIVATIFPLKCRNNKNFKGREETKLFDIPFVQEWLKEQYVLAIHKAQKKKKRKEIMNILF